MPLTPKLRTLKGQSGVGLIEVLISLLVMATGVLGLVGLQLNSFTNNRTAYYRTQATVLAYDIIARQRANLSQARLGAYAVTAGASSGSVCTSACTPAKIAETDLIQWKTEIAAQLPQGDGSITAIPGVLNSYQVNVQWSINQSDATVLSFGVQI